MRALGRRGAGGQSARRAAARLEGHLERRLAQAVRGTGGTDPSDGAQRGEGVHERLHVGLVDLAVTFREHPLLLLGARQRQRRLPCARDFHGGDFVGLVTVNAEVLPLERVRQRNLEQRRRDADHIRFVVEFRVHFVPVGLAKKHAHNGAFAGLGLGGILRGVGAERHLYRRLIEPVFRQVRGEVRHKARDLLPAQLMEQARRGPGVDGFVLVPDLAHPRLPAPGDHDFLLARTLDTHAIHEVRFHAQELLVAQIIGLRVEQRFEGLRHHAHRVARRELHVDLLLPHRPADLQHRRLFGVPSKKCDRSARLLQAKGGEIRGIARERADLRVGDLGNQVVDPRIVAARLERLGQRPVLILLPDFHLPGRGLEQDSLDACGCQGGQVAVTILVHPLRHVAFQLRADDMHDGRVLESHIKPTLDRCVLAEEQFHRLLPAGKSQARLRVGQSEFLELLLGRTLGLAGQRLGFQRFGGGKELDDRR